MTRILITGGLGFLGSHLARALVGEEVIILDSHPNDERVRDISGKVKIIRASLGGDVKKIVRDINADVVFHLGAFTLPYREKSFLGASMEANIRGTANLLEALAETNVKKFIYTSSSEVYGSQNIAPFTEKMVPRPTSPYSVTKLAGETYTMFYNDTYGLPATVLRLFNIYGPYQTPNRVIPEVIVSCLKGAPFRMTRGEQTREFNYVDDMVDALVLASKSDVRGEIINVGCGEGVAIKDVVKKVVTLMDARIIVEKTMPYRDNEIWKMFSDSSKSHKLLGWHPKIPLEEGLKRTTEWYKKQWALNKDSICFKGE